MRRRRKKKHPFAKILFYLLALFFSTLFMVGAFFGIKGYQIYREAMIEKPIIERIEEIRNMPGFASYSDLPQFYIDAVVSVEDHRFESHCGIDLIAIARAALADIKEMSFVQGGSTITQQLAKNLLFTQEKRLERKVAEVFAALELESVYTKGEIFELYVNTAYFGNGYYGIGQASEGYFGKKLFELTEYECAALAGIPNMPSRYSAGIDTELAVQRTQIVLDSMVKNKVITKEEADRIVSQKD